MAKKRKNLPDLSKQDILTPLDLSTMGTNGDPCFGVGYDLSIKNVSYVETQSYVHLRCHRI